MRRFSGPGAGDVTATVPDHWPETWAVPPRWFDEEAFWVAVRPALFAPGRWDDAERDLPALLALLQAVPPDRILDVACGPGRHLLPLARFGYRMTGVDGSLSYLREIERRADSEGLEVETVHADLTGPVWFAVPHPGPFDGAIWLDSSIGYGPTVEADLSILQGLRALLRPGARLVVETLGWECVEGETRVLGRNGTDVERQTVGAVDWVSQRRITKDRWMEVRWGPEDGEPRCYRHRLYRGAELSDMLRDVDYRNVLCYGDIHGMPYGSEAPTLVLVAEA